MQGRAVNLLFGFGNTLGRLRAIKRLTFAVNDLLVRLSRVKSVVAGVAGASSWTMHLRRVKLAHRGVVLVLSGTIRAAHLVVLLTMLTNTALFGALRRQGYSSFGTDGYWIKSARLPSILILLYRLLNRLCLELGEPCVERGHLLLFECLLVIKHLAFRPLFEHDLVKGGHHGTLALFLLQLRHHVRCLVHALLLLRLNKIHGSRLGLSRLPDFDGHILRQHLCLGVRRRLLSLGLIICTDQYLRLL